MLPCNCPDTTTTDKLLVHLMQIVNFIGRCETNHIHVSSKCYMSASCLQNTTCNIWKGKLAESSNKQECGRYSSYSLVYF